MDTAVRVFEAKILSMDFSWPFKIHNHSNMLHVLLVNAKTSVRLYSVIIFHSFSGNILSAPISHTFSLRSVRAAKTASFQRNWLRTWTRFVDRSNYSFWNFSLVHTFTGGTHFLRISRLSELKKCPILPPCTGFKFIAQLPRERSRTRQSGQGDICVSNFHSFRTPPHALCHLARHNQASSDVRCKS